MNQMDHTTRLSNEACGSATNREQRKRKGWDADPLNLEGKNKIDGKRKKGKRRAGYI